MVIAFGPVPMWISRIARTSKKPARVVANISRPVVNAKRITMGHSVNTRMSVPVIQTVVFKVNALTCRVHHCRANNVIVTLAGLVPGAIRGLFTRQRSWTYRHTQ